MGGDFQKFLIGSGGIEEPSMLQYNQMISGDEMHGYMIMASDIVDGLYNNENQNIWQSF